MADTDFEWSVTLASADGTGVNTYNQASFAGRNYARTSEGTGFGPAMADMLYTLRNAWRTTSSSSHSFTTGSKTFAIGAGGFGFEVGSPVRVAKSSTEVMDGTCTAVDFEAQTLTVNITSVAGSGSNSAWTITQSNYVSTTVSTPVSIPNGGTAAITAASARTNLEVGRLFHVTSVVSTPPGSPADQQKHIVGSSPTGVYVGNEHKTATFTTGVGWAFTTPTPGDVAYDSTARKAYVYTGTSNYSTGIYPGSYWVELTTAKARWQYNGIKSANYTVLASDHNKQYLVSTSGSNITITLPTPSAASGEAADMEILFEVPNSNGHNTIFQISGGSNIRLNDGTEAANITVTAGSYKLLHLKCGNAGSLNNWYALR